MSNFNETILKGWKIKKISNLLDYERPDKYTVKNTAYSDKYKTPVLTANKSFVLGFTDEDFGIYDDVPVIIFDDFTTDSKYVDFPFKVKSSAIKILKAKNKDVNLRFVYEKIKSIKFPVGNHKRYYISEFQKMDVAVPPFQEQNKIAEILSKVDEDIEKTDEIIKKTEELKKGLMQELLVKGIGHRKFKKTELGNIPEEWEIVKIEKFGKIITGSTPKTSNRNYYGNEYLWVSPKDINSNKYILNTEKKLTTQGFDVTRKLAKGSVLVVCIGSTIGKIALAGKKLSTNQQINSIITNDKFLNEYVYYLLLFNKNKIINKKSTQAVPILNKTTFSNIEIVATQNKNEQKKIIGILSILDYKIDINKKIKSKLTKLKRGLMQDLLSGNVQI
ncbi:restriction endonuclease subunit S [Candidatus Parcubacteria bacterium]|nr:restriction endonuclease subunit S [Candidatus Parcubacteria bacterium]